MRMWSLKERAVKGGLKLLGLGAALAILALAAGNSEGVSLIQAQDFEGFEAGSLGPAWQTGGDAPWFVQSTIAHRGSFAAQAGEIGDNGTSWLEISCSVPKDGTIGFWYRVSSESGCDFLRFFIDGQEMDRWSGETGWQPATFPITAGHHTLRWEYTKDGSISFDYDTAWLDDIFFPFTVGGPQACTITVSPGQSIQRALNEAKEGAVICLGEGTWEENIMMTKSLTLKGQGPEKTIIKGKEEGKPVILVESDEEIEVTIEGLKVAEGKGGIRIDGKSRVTIRDSQISENDGGGIVIGGSSVAEIWNNSISDNGWGIGMGGSSVAEIWNNSISDNREAGIRMGGFSRAKTTGNSISDNYFGIKMKACSQATIEGNKIYNNKRTWGWVKGYGVVLYQRPCYDVSDWDLNKFEGTVCGKGNEIHDNDKDVCPDELQFLMTSEGGCYRP